MENSLTTGGSSLLLFGSHHASFTPGLLSDIRDELLLNPNLSPLRDAAQKLPSFWERLTKHQPLFQDLPVSPSLMKLSLWAGDHAPSLQVGGEAKHLNSYTLALTVLLHISQYTRYIRQQRNGLHADVLRTIQQGGAQGFCVGLLTAIAIATAKDEADIGATAATALRLAVYLGAYVDLDAKSSPDYSCVAVLWKEDSGTGVDDVRAAIRKYPNAYISSINDALSVTITASVADIDGIRRLAHDNRWVTKPVQVTGRFHNPAYSRIMDGAVQFILSSAELNPLHSRKLLAPVRSTINGELLDSLSAGDAIRAMVGSILLEPVDWYSTIKASYPQEGETSTRPTVVIAGIGNAMPQSVAARSSFDTVHLDNSAGAGREGGVLNNPPLDASLAMYPPHAVAIVGMAGKFAGADSVDELWDLLLQGKVMVQPAPVDKFQLPQTGDYANTKWWGNFLQDSDAFDHKFFKKSSREAAAWDPQQRILLEVIYEALASSGYFSPSAVKQPDDYGCYIGAVMNNYYDNLSCHPATAYATLGTSRCYISGAMSHYFGWTGPSLTIDTACSSSLVAINQACRAIASGECSRAIAGGTNVICSPFDYVNLSAAGFLSPSGQCKPFDASADGYCRGEGVGVVVLKKLTDAIKEKDHILGVIVGSAANQNHNLHHITVPHSGSQADLYTKVAKMGSVVPESVSYVEAHGTGTGVGDPVEIASIRDVFGGPQRTSVLPFASIKGSIGHTEATAGVAGLIKVLLMMRHGKIPMQTSHTSLNPKLPRFDGHNMIIPKETLPWNEKEKIALVNSYGAAGSNSAVMVRQGPMKNVSSATRSLPEYPFFFSAASSTSLLNYSKKLLGCIRGYMSDSSVTPEMLSFSLSDRADHALPHIFATSATSLAALSRKLEDAVSSGANTHQIRLPRKPLVMVFGGQESNCIGLSEEIYQSNPIFKKHLDACNDHLVAIGQGSLYPVIFQKSPVDSVVLLQSALFAIQYASARSWQDCGLQIDAVVGHSFGHLTALCVSGTLSLADALTLVVGRAKLTAEHWGSEQGSMIYLQANRQNVEQILDALIAETEGFYGEIACHNGPDAHVVAGTADSIARVRDAAARQNIPIRTEVLNVTHAFHSKFTEPALPGLKVLSSQLHWNEPSIYIESCVEFDGAAQLDAESVADHMRHPVFFQQAIGRLQKRFPNATWLEAGRGSSVMGLVKRCLINKEEHSTIVHPRIATTDGQASLTKSTLELWTAGHGVRHWALQRNQRLSIRHLSLPPYQFDKTRHWLGFTAQRGQAGSANNSTPVAEEEEGEPKFFSFLGFEDGSGNKARFDINPSAERFKMLLGGHVMSGQPLAPASMYYEILSRAALTLEKDTEAKTYVPTLDNLSMKAPIGTDLVQIVLTMTRIKSSNPAWACSFATRTSDKNKWTEVTTAGIELKKRQDPGIARDFKRFASLIGSRRYDEVSNHPDAEKMRGTHVYRAFNTVVHYSQAFHGIKDVSCLGNEAVGRVVVTPDVNDPADQRLVDTPMTDSMMQFCGFLINYFNNPSTTDVFVCSQIGHVELGGDFDPDAGEWLVYSNMTDEGNGNYLVDAYAFDGRTNKMVATFFGFSFSKIAIDTLARVLMRVNQSSPSNQANAKMKAGKRGPATDAIKAPTTEIRLSEPSRKSRSTKTAGPSPTKMAVWNVLANVTDTSVSQLRDGASLDDLGVDSLMATEILNDIRTTLGLTIDLATFLFFPDLKAIADHVEKELGGNTTEEGNSYHVAEDDDVSLSSEPMVETVRLGKTQSKRQELLQILSDVSDVPLADIQDSTTWDLLGIDSLMATEVLNDVRSNLGINVDLSTFLFYSDFGAFVSDIDESLGFSSQESASSTPSSGNTSPSSMTQLSESPDDSSSTPDDISKGAMTSTDGSGGYPTIISASNSFAEIKSNYDQVAGPVGALKFWREAYPHQARLVLAYVVEAFANMGHSLQSYQAGEIVPRPHVLGKHQQLLSQLYRILEDGGLVSSNNDTFVRTDKPTDDTPAETIYHEMVDLYPQHASVNKLVRAVGSEFANCLTGRKDGLQIVFGDKENKKTLEDMYEFWPILRVPSLLLGDFFVKAMTNATGKGPFRILEVGAGTGGTTKYIVKRLKNYGIPFEYVFTDISGSLVKAAKKNFKEYDGMSFEVLDLEQPPKPEQEGAFHCIIATNCVHACRDLDVVLPHLRKMLRSDGALALVEITRPMFCLDIIVGLFEGWWLFQDGRSYALIDELSWQSRLMKANFKEVQWTHGQSPESETVRVIAGFPTVAATQVLPKTTVKAAVETVVYKKVDNLDICADVYYPIEGKAETKMPVALMIHGGSHVIFSRKDVRPAQTRLLLERGFIPVSLDHRLCPEITLAKGPMVDVCDALEWARVKLPTLKLKGRPDLQMDGDRVVVVGWSSGGQLAMSLAWTAPSRGIRPPDAILAFYCPTDYEDDWWRHPIQPLGAEDTGYEYDVLEAIQDKPICNYGVIGAWEPLSDPRILADPRCRIVLHINWKAQTLPVIIGGLPSRKQAQTQNPDKDWNSVPQPTLEQIREVSPLAHIRDGEYHVPTFLIHGTADDLIPWEQTDRTHKTLLSNGVTAGLALVKGAPHICDLSTNQNSEGWKAVVQGYDFIGNYV